MCPTIFRVICDVSTTFFARFVQLTANIFITTVTSSFFVIFPHPTRFIKVNIYYTNSHIGADNSPTVSLTSRLTSSLHHTDFDVWVINRRGIIFFVK